MNGSPWIMQSGIATGESRVMRVGHTDKKRTHIKCMVNVHTCMGGDPGVGDGYGSVPPNNFHVICILWVIGFYMHQYCMH